MNVPQCPFGLGGDSPLIRELICKRHHSLEYQLSSNPGVIAKKIAGLGPDVPMAVIRIQNGRSQKAPVTWVPMVNGGEYGK